MKILLVEDNNDFLELAAEKIPLLEIERGWCFKIAATTSTRNWLGWGGNTPGEAARCRAWVLAR